MPKPELYFSPQPTRSARARWAFHEAGAPFAPHSLDIFKGEHRTPTFAAVNSLRKLPAARFDGETIIESSAIAWIMTQGDDKLVPPAGTAAWRRAIQWVVFAPAELDHRLEIINEERMFLPPAERSSSRLEQTKAAIRERLTFVAFALNERPYLAGETFSVADICVGHSLAWAQMHELLNEHAKCASYLATLQQRDAFQQVYGPKLETVADPHAA